MGTYEKRRGHFRPEKSITRGKLVKGKGGWEEVHLDRRDKHKCGHPIGGKM